MNEQQDFVEVAEYLTQELKRHDRLRRVCDTLNRLGSLANAAIETEKRIVDARRKLQEQHDALASAQQSVEQAKIEAHAILDKAQREGAAIIEQKRREGDAEAASIAQALQNRRDELAAVSERLSRATEFLK